MPLLDHFRRPVSFEVDWTTFHATWANSLMARLNEMLPARYIAGVNVKFGRQFEADVAEMERERAWVQQPNGTQDVGGVAVATYAPPTTTATITGVFPDDLEIPVFDRGDGSRQLVAAIELVSPANKARPEERRVFVAKCAAYLSRGIGLIVVDVVTTRQSDLFAELLEFLQQPTAARLPEGTWIHAAAFRPIRRKEENQIDIWLEPLALERSLPTLPLALLGAGCVPVELDTTYNDARRRCRL